MEEATRAHTNPGHYKAVAQDFGVHFRTVLRWVKYGWLESKNGRITTDYKTCLLSDWKRSCSFKEAGAKLAISNGTMSAWKRKGLIETIKIMGFKRVLLSSLDEINKRRKSGTFSLHPTHSLPALVLEITGVSRPSIKKALDIGSLNSDLIDGVRMIPNEEVAKIKKEWISSCRPVGVQRALGISKHTVRRWKKRGRLPTITVLGQERVVLRGLAKTSEQKQRLKEYLRKEKKKYRFRVNYATRVYRKKQRLKQKEERQKIRTKQSNQKRFRAKRMDLPYRPPHRVTIQLPDYKPEQVMVRGFESRRLTTCEEAAKATAKTPREIRELYGVGKLRGEEVDEQVFIYVVSVEALVTKLRQGIKYTAD